MSHKHPFLPFGTVSARKEFACFGEDHKKSQQDFAPLLELIDPASEFDLDEDVFFLAWELLKMQHGLCREDLHAGLVFVLATLINLRQGSTCLPLGPKGGLLKILEAIIPKAYQEQEAWQIDRMQARIKAMIEGGRLDALLGRPGEFKPLILEDGAVYHQRMLHYEEQLVEVLDKRFACQRSTVNLLDVERVVSCVFLSMPCGLDGMPVRLTREQQFAALLAVHEPWTIITGGPGTGKTSVVVTILRLFARLGTQRIALAAPTGKAANRMQESIISQLSALPKPDACDQELLEHLPVPQTLHRLLGYSTHHGLFHHHEYHKLDAQVVVVDEASMIDLFMMAQLVRAVRDDAHIVLLGDAEQLPSVDSGAVLRDLIPDQIHTDTAFAHLVDPPIQEKHMAPVARGVARLTRSHRMSKDDPCGRHILSVAQRVRQGDVEDLFGMRDDQIKPVEVAESCSFEGVVMISARGMKEEHVVAERLQGFVQVWFERHITGGNEDFFQDLVQAPFVWCEDDGDGEGGFGEADEERIKRLWSRIHSVRLLSLTRVFAAGTRAINEMFLTRVRAALGAHTSEVFMPGVPVMMTRNDYDREIFNGDQGLILPTVAHGKVEPMVVFARGGSFVAFGLERLMTRLEVAFAMTVHKSQGSEFEHVALVLPSKPLPLLTREVIYTGMTRSRVSSVFWGDPEVLVHGIKEAMLRHSRIAKKLKR